VGQEGVYAGGIFEKIRMDSKVISMAVMVVCSVNEQEH
jgi:hypothetical protein